MHAISSWTEWLGYVLPNEGNLYDLPKGPFLSCPLVDKKRLAAFQNALHVAVWVCREQTDMVSAVLPQS